jgi:hypothetical protein
MRRATYSGRDDPVTGHGGSMLGRQTMTPEQFFDHVDEFIRLSLEFEQAVGLSNKELGDFATKV